MRLRILALISLAALALAEDDLERVACRVISAGQRAAITIDRGKSDGLAVGDRVFLYPRGGGTHTGFVIQVDDRSAVVEMNDRRVVIDAGTKGEVAVPKGRLAAMEEPEPPPAEKEKKPDKPGGVPEHPPFENQDEDYEPGRPLLAGMRPVRPKERPREIRGRVYGIANVTNNRGDDYTDSLLRVGADVTVENPVGQGGVLNANAELSYLTELDNDEELELFVRRLSYAWGGTRFTDMRLEVGRFLQHGMVEFGVLDGAEWMRRRPNGHRYGVSLGYLPEPDDDFESASDFSAAAFYEYVSDVTERFVAAIGFQKTWHHGDADRDLLVAKFRHVPPDSWHVHGTVWIDFYTGKDTAKDSIELTQVVLTFTRRWKNDNGLDVTFTHITFPQLLRNGEFTPILLAELADNRVDRLAIDGWRWLNDRLRLIVHGSVYNDEDDTGGAVEIGVEVSDVLLSGTRFGIFAFGTLARFEEVAGGRVSLSRQMRKGRWDILYEVAQHHLLDFPNDRDDILQHRARASMSFYLDGGWDVSVHAEGWLYDSELSWSFGFSFQKQF